jgi:hypothetical protein
MWDVLGISPCDDPKAIRRAYAARLKKLDPDRDPSGFARLREALEWALAEIEDTAAQPFRPNRVRPLDPEATQDALGDLDEQLLPATGDESRDHVLPASDEPTAGDVVADAHPKGFDVAASDLALLDDIKSALGRRDATAAMTLFYRAAATGAVPLHDTPALLDRLFALVVGDTTVERGAFRDFARTFGWDRPTRESGTTSEPRKRVLARLAAEDWYESLIASSAPRAPVTRKQANLARLMLGKIGRYRTPRIDSVELKTRLDEFRTHEAWLRGLIDPAWASTLEKRWRRREIVWSAFLGLFLVAMLLNGMHLLVTEAVAGTLSLGVIVAAPFVAAFLLWILKLLVTELYRLTKKQQAAVIGPPAIEADSDPPDDAEVRLRWLEQRAELAYEAMYDAPAGSASAALYSDVKEFLYDAIALAHRLGQSATAERLSQRLAEIKAVYRSQFSA